MTQSIPTGQIDKSKKLFIASGVLAVLYAVWLLIMDGPGSFYMLTYPDINFKVVVFSHMLAYISFLPFGILCIVRRNSDTIPLF